MLATLNSKEACSKQNKERHDDVLQYKIEALVMNKNFGKELKWDAKYIPNFRIISFTGPRQLEFS